MAAHDMAVAVVSFDGYADIWDTFALCLGRFWPDRTAPTYLITNHAEPRYEGIRVVTTGDEIAWSRRVRIALESIREDYILLLLEDYLLSRPVEEAAVRQALDYMADEDLDYLRIAPIPVLKPRQKDVYASEITSRMMYGINLQAAIWKRDFLLAALSSEDFSAWEFEARQKFGAPTRVAGRCYATRDFVIPYLNGIIQGKWYQRTVDELASLGISVPLGTRAIMTDKDMRREDRRDFLLHHIPPFIIRLCKPIARKMGFRFVT